MVARHFTRIKSYGSDWIGVAASVDDRGLGIELKGIDVGD